MPFFFLVRNIIMPCFCIASRGHIRPMMPKKHWQTMSSIKQNSIFIFFKVFWLIMSFSNLADETVLEPTNSEISQKVRNSKKSLSCVMCLMKKKFLMELNANILWQAETVTHLCSSQWRKTWWFLSADCQFFVHINLIN